VNLCVYPVCYVRNELLYAAVLLHDTASSLVYFVTLVYVYVVVTTSFLHSSLFC